MDEVRLLSGTISAAEIEGLYDTYDSDGDDMSDAWERAKFGSLAANPNDNPDQDGLTNIEEFKHGTHPTNPDSDGDGMSDGNEVMLNRNPNAAAMDGTGTLILKVHTPTYR